MLAFIHFSMLKGIDKNENELCLTEQQVHQYILPAFKLDKQNIAKNLLKCLYWALTLGTSKKFVDLMTLVVLDPLKMNKDHF
jgi:hypothetical protein